MLWADQLCINQADPMERSAQVSMMGKIFTNARRVIMWMGPDESPDPLAPHCINTMSRIASISHEEHPLHEGLVTDELLSACDLPTIGSPAWMALRTLFDLPYFERLWVYQEVYLAATKRVLWGEVDLDFDHIKTSLAFIRRYRLLWASNELFGPFGPRSAYCMLSARPYTLHELLDNTSTFKVSEIRDRVYGVISLVEDGVPVELRNSMLQVDYTEPVMVTFMKATIYVLQTAARVDFLEQSGLWLQSEPSRQVGDVDDLIWPSWQPRWQGGRTSLRSKGPHGAACEMLVNRHITMQAMEKLQLRLSGHTVARVAHVAPPLKETNSIQTPESLMPLRAAWELCREHLVPRRDWKEAFEACLSAHTLCDFSGFSERPYREAPMLYEFAMLMAFSAVQWLKKGIIHCSELDDNLRLAFIAAALHKPAKVATLHHSVDELDIVVQDWRAYRLRILKQGMTTSGSDPFASTRNDLRDVIHDPELLEHAAESITALTSLYAMGTNIGATLVAFGTSHAATLIDRRFFITDQGHIGVGPSIVQPGNPVVILHGGKVPHVLEQRGGSYVLLGCCYLEGIMEGQYIQRMIDEGGVEKVEAVAEHFDLS